MSKPTILLVDDCLVVKKMLVKEGYRVIVARDGEEALGKLTENPSLILLDVNMPVLDGFGFCRQLRIQKPEYQELPIIFLTSENTNALELLGKSMGGYLQKPVDREDLLAAIDARLTDEVAS